MTRGIIAVLLAVGLVVLMDRCTRKLLAPEPPPTPVHCPNSDAANRWCYHA